jgi:hypothetical protein
MAFLRPNSFVRLALAARRGCLRWLVLAALLGTAGATASAQNATSAEYRVKAVFLFNFAQFVEWPARTFRDARSPLVIGVLGDDPFGAFLDEAVAGEKIGDRPLLVRRYRRVEEIADCHILFISRSESGQLEKIIASLKGRSVLTVGDTDTFIRKGGLVRFVTENNKIRLRINVEAARASDLTISSKLLRPATIVTADKD